MAKVESIAPLTKAAAVELKKLAAGCRISFTKFGVKRSLTVEQRDEAASVFEAEGSYLEARRRLIDTRHDAWKSVTKVFSQCKDYWKGLTLPYPEPGIRLIRQDWVTSFTDTMDDFKEELKVHVKELDVSLPGLKTAAKAKSGKLYNEGDYPKSFLTLFGIEYDFPSLEPPEYLKKLAPHVYEQEVARIQARFDEAVVLAEQGFTSEFHKLVAHLSAVITGGADGQKKVFKDSAVENLTEFFDRFRALSVRSSKDLDELVDKAKDLCKGVTPDDLRGSEELRTSLGKNMSDLSKELEKMLVHAPKRKVVKGAGKAQQEGAA